MIGIWDKEGTKTKINKHRTDTKTWQSQRDSKRKKKITHRDKDENKKTNTHTVMNQDAKTK